MNEQKELMNLKQTIRENRGMGYPDMLNQRFRNAAEKLKDEGVS